MHITLGTLLGFFGMAIAAALPGVGSALGVGLVGQAASGVITEDPDKFGSTLLLQAIPGTQGIYGFLSSVVLMSRLGVFGGKLLSLTTHQGVLVILAALPITIVGLTSAIYQGQVAATGVNIIAKRPEEIGKAMIYAAVVETYAVISLIVTLLLISGIPLGGVAG